MSETAVIEPGGWLAEFQRKHCTGGTAMATYQGLLADEIILPQSADEHADPNILVLACDAWATALQEQVHLIPGEFAPEALWSFYAHDYLSQAKAGGHAQYYASRGNDEIALRCCASALKSMLADPHYELFNLMVKLKRLPRPAARKLAAQKGYRDIAAALRDLDKKLLDLEQKEPLTPRHKTWLKSLRKFSLAPDAEMTTHLARIAKANPLFQQRKAEAERIRAEHERDDPAYRAAKALCEMAGLKFAGLAPGAFAEMQSVWPEGPQRAAFVMRVDTDRGPRAAALYTDGGLIKSRLAVLLERGQALPIGSLKLPRRDYEAIVPAAR